MISGNGRLRTGAIALHSALLLAACARPFGASTALTSVPYSLEASGRIVIDVTLNDRGPYRFAIDSAATGSFVFATARDELGLEDVSDETSIVRGVVASGTFPVVEVESLAVGSEELTDIRLTSLPGNTNATESLDGVLGSDFLRRYAIAFSVRDRRLSFYAPLDDRDRVSPGWATIRIQPVQIGRTVEPLPYLQIRIAGRTVPALFDLGAGISVLNTAAARALRLQAELPDQVAELSGAVGTVPVLVRLSSQSLSTGNVGWRDETLLIADLEIFETLGSTDEPLAILGSGLFNQRDFAVDLKNNRLLVRIAMSEQPLAANPFE